MLKSRSTRPPGGWKFIQPQTGWSLPPGLDFTRAVNMIIEHRRKNLRFNFSTDFDTVANELDDYTCRLLKNSSAYCVESSSPAPFTPPPPVHRRPEGKKGAGFLRENAVAANRPQNTKISENQSWVNFFGALELIAPELAERRAAICARCPHNKQDELMQIFGIPIGMEHLEVFTMLNNMNKQTRFDDRLQFCNVGSYSLKAKVWSSIDVMRKNLSEKRISSLPRHCWILKEV